MRGVRGGGKGMEDGSIMEDIVELFDDQTDLAWYMVR